MPRIRSVTLDVLDQLTVLDEFVYWMRGLGSDSVELEHVTVCILETREVVDQERLVRAVKEGVRERDGGTDTKARGRSYPEVVVEFM